MVRKILMASVIFLVSATSVGGSWSAFGSDHDDLKGYTIAAVGDLSAESHLDFESGRRFEWHEFSVPLGETVCIEILGASTSNVGDMAAAILVDQAKNYRLAVFESSIASIKVSVMTFQPIQCPRFF